MNSLRFENEILEEVKRLLELFNDKETVNRIIHEHIDVVEGYFRKYDSIQLLGSVGLYLIDNLPNVEKCYNAKVSNIKLELDEDAEVIAEYALNFGLSMNNDYKKNPTDDVIIDLRERLRMLSKIYSLLDMPIEYNPSKYIDWVIHSKTIAVRGDGYQVHVQDVFKELFVPHSSFYLKTYGYSIEDLVNFFDELEDRIICKIGDQKHIYGCYKMWERWKKWEENNRSSGDTDAIMKNGLSKGIFGDFFEANPDVSHTKDGNHFLLFEHDDYRESNKIFWVLPQNETEKKILESLSVEFGSNGSFIEDGEFKGNIMNGQNIYEKPFVKDGDKYYCFTPMLPHRNMFLIAEELMRRDQNYYGKNFQQNKVSISHDKYVEKKAKRVFESFLPFVKFHQSVNYWFADDKGKRTAELDILGISDKATYIIEVKAGELKHKDCVGLKGAKDKFKSVAEACHQCLRAAKYVNYNESPSFSGIVVDKTKPLYKIAVTFHHHATLLGNMDMLVESGLFEESYRDTWIVSLFDLMVVADFFKSENEFIEYLEMHKVINENHSIFYDELDLLSGFLNNDLAKKIKHDKALNIIGGSELIDEKYVKDYLFDIRTPIL